MVPERSTRSPGRTASAESETSRSTTPTPAVVTYSPSAFPRSTTFVSPATTATPDARAASAIEAATRRRSAIAKPLLHDEAGGEVEWPGSRHREVVDRAVHRERPDVAAREEERLDDEGVSRERKARAGALEHGRVGERSEQRIPELLEEEGLDERVRRLPPRSVRERHDVVPELAA